MDQKLIDYITSARQNGLSDDQINTALINVGWDATDVKAAMQTDSPTSVSKYKGLIITTVVVIVLVMAGAVYWYWLRPAPTTQGSVNQLNNIQNQPAITQINTINCGTAGFIGFLDNNKVDAAVETIKAWECFTDNLQACNPALLKAQFAPPFPVEGNSPPLQPTSIPAIEFKIIGKQGDLCLVSGPKGPLGYGVPVTCAFSKRLIDWAYSQSEQAHPGVKFFKSFGMTGIIFMGGGLVPEAPVPGVTQENVVCN
ncbi:MAG: hypothetical protein WC575_00915 [Patescibacteria group bacterium]